MDGESVASGWTFMAGDEDQDDADNPDHWAIYELNTICNYDQAIIPYLDSPIGTAWSKNLGATAFERERRLTAALTQMLRPISDALVGNGPLHSIYCSHRPLQPDEMHGCGCKPTYSWGTGATARLSG